MIVSKAANVGDMVTPFSSAVDSKGAVVSMADMATLEVEADVSESSLAKVKVGQPCEITLDALPDSRFRGRISRMVPTVDRAKATVMTKVQFDAIDPRILPEMRHQPRRLRRRLRRAHGAVGLGEVHAAQHGGRHRQPSTGVIRIAGVDIAQLSETDLAAWRSVNVGFIFQFYNLMPVLTAFDKRGVAAAAHLVVAP